MPADDAYAAEFASFDWDLPESYNIAQDVCGRHAQSGAVAAIHLGETTDRLTFGDLERSSGELAGLLAAAGVQPGSRVAILLGNSPDAAIAALAVLRLGAVVTPVPVRADAATLAFQLATAAPAACVVDAELPAAAAEAMAEFSGPTVVTNGTAWREGWGEGGGATPGYHPTQADAAAFLVFTSGSTGMPKPVLLPHRFVLGTLPTFRLLTNLGPFDDDVFYASLGWNGLGGLRPIILPAWHHGRPVVVSADPPARPDELCDLLGAEGVTCAHLMPAVLKPLRDVSDPGSLRRLERLRVAYYAGEPLGPALQATLETRLGIVIHAYYGSTEAAMVAASCARLFPHRPGTVGRPVPGHAVEILDEQTLAPVPAGSAGIIAIAADDPCVCLGYPGRPDLEAEAFCEGRFQTGDIGRIDEEGYLWYVGRRGEVITIASGDAVPATRIEDVALAQHGVHDAVSVQVEHDGSRTLLLYVVADAAADATAITTALARALPRELVPERIRFVDELPRTPGTGKVRRSVLRAAAVTELAAGL